MFHQNNIENNDENDNDDDANACETDDKTRLMSYIKILFTPKFASVESRFGFCVVSERIQASHCVADRPLAVLTGLAEPDPVTRSGKKQTWGSIFKSHIV